MSSPTERLVDTRSVDELEFDIYQLAWPVSAGGGVLYDVYLRVDGATSWEHDLTPEESLQTIPDDAGLLALLRARNQVWAPPFLYDTDAELAEAMRGLWDSHHDAVRKIKRGLIEQIVRLVTRHVPTARAPRGRGSRRSGRGRSWGPAPGTCR